jgi:hypothetical protein
LGEVRPHVFLEAREVDTFSQALRLNEAIDFGTCGPITDHQEVHIGSLRLDQGRRLEPMVEALLGAKDASGANNRRPGWDA